MAVRANKHVYPAFDPISPLSIVEKSRLFLRFCSLLRLLIHFYVLNLTNRSVFTILILTFIRRYSLRRFPGSKFHALSIQFRCSCSVVNFHAQQFQALDNFMRCNFNATNSSKVQNASIRGQFDRN